MKLEEIHRNLAILPLQWESRALVVRFGRNLKKSTEIWSYCPYTKNRGTWVLSKQVGDKGSKRPLDGLDDG